MTLASSNTDKHAELDGWPDAAGLSDTFRRSWHLIQSEGRLALGGALVLLTIITLAFLIPALSPFDWNGQDLTSRLQPPLWIDENGLRRWFGTDALGRDILTRVFVGARLSLLVSFGAVAGAALVGTVLGLLAGYLGGRVDTVIMRTVDLQLAFPVMLLALSVVALIGPNLVNLILVFVLTGWPGFARTVRASSLALREKRYVEAARGLGAGRARIMGQYILPNALGPLTVVATFELAKVLIFESSLSFLSLGIQPPIPTWGNIMAEGRSLLEVAWWVTFFPGIMLVFAAMAANLTGDGLNSIVDPRLRKQ